MRRGRTIIWKPRRTIGVWEGEATEVACGMRPVNGMATWACDYDVPIQGEVTSPVREARAIMVRTKIWGCPV